MGKCKAAQNCKFLPWLTAKTVNNDEGRFLQVANSFMLSPVVGHLSPGAFHLYMCMCNEAGGKREFTFPNRAIGKYHISVRSARRWIEELIDEGFIKRNSGKNTREANIYEFINDWKTRSDKE